MFVRRCEDVMFASRSPIQRPEGLGHRLLKSSVSSPRHPSPDHKGPCSQASAMVQCHELIKEIVQMNNTNAMRLREEITIALMPGKTEKPDETRK